MMMMMMQPTPDSPQVSDAELLGHLLLTANKGQGFTQSIF
jgi:hypothetical protein